VNLFLAIYYLNVLVDVDVGIAFLSLSVFFHGIIQSFGFELEQNEAMHARLRVIISGFDSKTFFCNLIFYAHLCTGS